MWNFERTCSNCFGDCWARKWWWSDWVGWRQRVVTVLPRCSIWTRRSSALDNYLSPHLVWCFLILRRADERKRHHFWSDVSLPFWILTHLCLWICVSLITRVAECCDKSSPKEDVASLVSLSKNCWNTSKNITTTGINIWAALIETWQLIKKPSDIFDNNRDPKLWILFRIKWNEWTTFCSKWNWKTHQSPTWIRNAEKHIGTWIEGSKYEMGRTKCRILLLASAKLVEIASTTRLETPAIPKGAQR